MERCGDFTEERSAPAGAVHGAGCVAAGAASLGAGGATDRCSAAATSPFIRSCASSTRSPTPSCRAATSSRARRAGSSPAARASSAATSPSRSPASDSHSLLLPRAVRPRARRCAWASCCRSSATSPPAANLLSYLRVEAVYTDPSGPRAVARPAAAGAAEQVLGAEPAGAAADGPAQRADAERAHIRDCASLHPEGAIFGSGTWRVDDIYVDPWKVDLAA